MKKNARDSRPYLPKVNRIELSMENTKVRMILLVVFLAIAVVSFAWGISNYLTTEPGWQRIEASAQGPTYEKDFVLQYDCSGAGASATVIKKQAVRVYSQAQEEAYRIFSPEAQDTDVHGIAYLNAHPNEKVTVAPGLYQAISLVKTYGNRHVFTAPAMGSYDSILMSSSDAEAALCDPEYDPNTAQWLRELSQFTGDPEAIWLELHGEEQVTLHVSQDYSAFARETEITTFLDFGWMRNGFIADYVAQALTENGLTQGYLVSSDGFTRNLDTRGQEYSVNLFDRQGGEIYMPARLQYAQPMAIVFLRDYPLTDSDRWRYYAYESGRMVTPFLDPSDCVSGAAADTLVAYSTQLGCGEILMQVAPVFTSDSFDPAPLLAADSIEFIWFEGKTLCHTQQDADLNLLTDVVAYQKQYVS